MIIFLREFIGYLKILSELITYNNISIYNINDKTIFGIKNCLNTSYFYM